MYSNCCCSSSFEAEIVKIGPSSHKMYSNNIVNFQESMTILNACTKKSGNLLNALRISGTSPLDCLGSYPGHSLTKWPYPSSEKQSVSSTALADWARRMVTVIFFPLFSLYFLPYIFPVFVSLFMIIRP